MDLQLDGKVAFISGSTQGIGYAIARSLLQEGAAVIINGRSGARVAHAISDLKAVVPGAEVSGMTCDVRDDEQVRQLLSSIQDVDILINNVGRFDVKDFVDISDDEWREYISVNLMSAVVLSRHVMMRMLSRGDGRIIFIGSESGVNVPPDMIHYGVTKAAALALANGLAKLTRGTGVTVNSILGGPTYSDGVAQALSRISEAQGLDVDVVRSAVIGSNTTSLLERFIEPDEIANLVTYLASPLSSATNGAALRADGGVLTTIT